MIHRLALLSLSFFLIWSTTAPANAAMTCAGACWPSANVCLGQKCCGGGIDASVFLDKDGKNIIKCQKTSPMWGTWVLYKSLTSESTTTPSTPTTDPAVITTTDGTPCNPNSEICSGQKCPQASLGTTQMDHDRKNIIACLISNDNASYKWKKMTIEGDDAVPKGSLCGMVENGDADWVKCKGVSFLHNACPEGYTKRMVYHSNDDSQYSCVKD